MRITFKSRMTKVFYVFIDILCGYACILAACLLRQKSLPFQLTFHNIVISEENPFRIIFVLWILLVVVFANIHRLYQTRRDAFEGFEIWQVFKTVVFSAVCAIVLIYALKIQDFPRSIILSATVFMFFALSLWRVAKRLFVEYLVAHGYNNVNVLIVGGGKIGLALLKEIEKHSGLGLRVVGFLDDFKKNVTGCDKPVLGKIADFEILAQKNFIKQIFITVHHDGQAFLRLLEQANSLQIVVRVVPQGFDLTTSDFFRFNIGIVPILEYSDANIERKQTGKRFFDFFVSLISFVILFPIFVMIAIAICIDSKGAPIYFSRRYGQNGKIFRMIKFRSMQRDAEKRFDEVRDQNEADGPIFKIKQDPRITRVGRFLRKYSLDELPQLFNVLKGEMSLVGPRPLPIDQIEKEDLRQLKRLGVKPGITGLWQIRGRSDISFERFVKWDIWYINNWSFWLDLNILIQTIPVVLKSKGAY